MKVFVPGVRAILLLLVSACVTADYSLAQTANSVKIPTALICGPFSGNPPRTPSLADKFTFNFSNGAFTGVRPTRVQKGIETYKGSIDPLGKIKISGVGHYDDHSSVWTSEYAGQLQEKAPTILQGNMRIKSATGGVYKCTLGFLLPPADLAKVFSPNEAAVQPRPQ
jgi:hypothetical protein